MIINWIVSSVPVSDRRTFSNRQRVWKQLANTPGFLGRIGGWNIKNPIEASIFTFWKDMDSYQESIEAGYFGGELDHSERSSIVDLQVYQKKNDIIGLKRKQVFAPIADCGHLLKIGDCQIKEEKKDNFLLMQQSVWNLGMANTPGMTTGLFAESVQATNRFLILTRWKNKDEYTAFEEHILPKLLHWAYDEKVEEQFQGRLIRLVKDWCFESA